MQPVRGMGAVFGKVVSSERCLLHTPSSGSRFAIGCHKEGWFGGSGVFRAVLYSMILFWIHGVVGLALFEHGQESFNNSTKSNADGCTGLGRRLVQV